MCSQDVAICVVSAEKSGPRSRSRILGERIGEGVIFEGNFGENWREFLALLFFSFSMG
jgi:hypothetical protein